MEQVRDLYEKLGGRFISTPAQIKERLMQIRAFVFDWDGVFNGGEKTAGTGSSFTEVDSMGVNLLRFSYFARHGQLPLTAVISGENNATAYHYCERENLHYSFYKVAHKIHALDFLCEKENLDPAHVCYFFDDVLDVPLAEHCGLRIQINQQVNPLFIDYCLRHKLVDYLTSVPGGKNALREATELLIALGSDYDKTVNARKNNSETYQKYITARRKITPAFYTLGDQGIHIADPRR